ncbi:DUF4430 domain-containing protein [Lacticaseibacillus hulanensis]|uniref:DUF4430 domain-containing protein n=1 Tax=Lacticaseibacillus hulanensis TaxID=2493111 RepID=UPI001F4DB287|nr:DUF4430 domain-containing protein [Lacticaseibacillus hulanensis]
MRRRAGLIALLAVALLAGCGKNAAAQTSSTGSKTVTTTKLAKNGVVTKAQMKNLANKGGQFTLSGKHDGIKYSWTYDSAQVKNPTKQKLALTITNAKSKAALAKVPGAKNLIGIKFAQFHLAGAPTLTITIPKRWSASAAVLLSGNKLTVDSATPVNLKQTAKTTQLSFKVTSVHRTVYLVGTTKTDKTKTIKKAKVVAKKEATKATSTKAKAKKAASKTKKHAAATSKSSSAASSASKASSSSKDAGSSSSHAVATSSAAVKHATHKTKHATAKATSSAPTVTISINASTAAHHLDQIKDNKKNSVPKSGVILPPTKVTLKTGESVYDVLKQVTAERGIQMEARWTPAYNAYYITGIHNLYEFDGGAASGWMYSVDGWFPNYGASSYKDLKNGSVIKWLYTLELGADVGGHN